MRSAPEAGAKRRRPPEQPWVDVALCVAALALGAVGYLVYFDRMTSCLPLP